MWFFYLTYVYFSRVLLVLVVVFLYGTYDPVNCCSFHEELLVFSMNWTDCWQRASLGLNVLHIAMLLKLVMLIIAEKIVVAIELFAQYYTINVSNKGVGVSMSQSNVMWWMYFVNLVGWLALSIRDLVPPQDPKF